MFKETSLELLIVNRRSASLQNHHSEATVFDCVFKKHNFNQLYAIHYYIYICIYYNLQSNMLYMAKNNTSNVKLKAIKPQLHFRSHQSMRRRCQNHKSACLGAKLQGTIEPPRYRQVASCCLMLPQPNRDTPRSLLSHSSQSAYLILNLDAPFFVP